MLTAVTRRVADRVPISFPRALGVYEALRYPETGTLEWMRRHALLIGWLEQVRNEVGASHLVVLDFGGASGSLRSALRLYRRQSNYSFLVADVDTEALEAVPEDERIRLYPEGTLPLGDASVDVVVSSDVFEHIPQGWRAHWAAELHRVTRLGQAHTFPADSRDGRWASTEADRALDAWFRETFGRPERWTAEHLASPEPVVEEMVALFPGASVVGFGNVEVWGEMLRDQLAPASAPRRLAFAVQYLLSRRAADHRPPWKGALLTVRTRSGR